MATIRKKEIEKKASIKKNNRLKNNMEIKINQDRGYLKDKIGDIKKVVSGELQKANENDLATNSILYLNKDQLISNNLEKKLDNLKIDIIELKQLIREIVIEEIKNHKLR